MIASLNGRIILKDENSVVIECAGVGYKCFVTKNTYYALGGIGDSAFLYTCLIVREDAFDLYGFSKSEGVEAKDQE